MLSSMEICAGAGGQALGLSMAGFEHVALIEYEKDYCDALKRNRPDWNVICGDIKEFNGWPYRFKVDLLAGGVPCPPFSVAGKQLGSDDERDLFPEMLRLVEEIVPKAVMIENVRGFLDPVFEEYRANIFAQLDKLGYNAQIKLLQASDYGVPQLRPRIVIVGIRKDIDKQFSYPEPHPEGVAPAAPQPAAAPVANEAPVEGFEGNPRLTPRMIARIQGFPDDWDFGKRKTAACRMIGNAFPPPVAQAVGEKIREVLE